MNSDILIIGGGVIGLTIARELRKNGAEKITLLEKGSIGQESSWAAAGMLSPQAEANESGPFFNLGMISRELYPDLAMDLWDETGVDVELDRTGTLYLAFTDDDAAELQKRFRWQFNEHWAVERLSAEATRRAEPFISPDVRGALFFPNDWQVDNRKLLAALKRYAEINEIEIRENTLVERLDVEDGRVTGAVTTSKTFTAENTIIATGAWTSLIKLGPSEMPFEVEPVRGQIITFQTAKQLFNHVICTPRGYIVPRADGRILAGSTTEFVGFEKQTTEAAALALRELATEIAPSLANLTTVDHWCGLRPHTADGLPVIGEFNGVENLIVATAHYRNGILLAPITAKLVAEKVAGNESKYFSEFSPEGFTVRGVGNAV